MKKGLFSSLIAVGLITAVFALPIANAQSISYGSDDSDEIDKSSRVIADKKEESNNTDNKNDKELPNKKDDGIVTFIVTLKGDTLIDKVISSNGMYKNVPEFIVSKEGKSCYDKIKKEQAVVKASIQKVIANSDFTDCYDYVSVVNGFTVKAPYSSMEKIKKINGVKSVDISEERTIGRTDFQEDETIDLGSLSKDMINMDFAYNSGYTGENVLIAVIDTSFDCNHEVFSVMPEETKYDQSDIAQIFQVMDFNVDNSYDSSDIYVSQKIVFAYDYFDNDNDTYNTCQHGTHVAGIAAGNNGRNDDKSFKGVAYDAQLALMKVGDDSEMMSDEKIMAACEDAAKLGADVLNCSFGEAIYCSSLDSAIKKLSDAGVCVIAAAGNESYDTSLYREGYIPASYIHYGTISNPSNLPEVLSVGACDTYKYFINVLNLNGQFNIEYEDIHNSDESEEFINDEFIFSDFFGENEEEYIYTYGYGALEDYDDIDVAGKIVVLKQGDISFKDKSKNALQNGAKGIIIISNSSDISFNFITIDKQMPGVIISNNNEKYFSENPKGVFRIAEDIINNKTGGKPSIFTSYGVTEDLKLKPEITAPGSNIYASVPNNKYDLKSGTSMASPCVAGIAALLRQYISENNIFSNMTANEQNEYILSLIMSTADAVKYTDDSVAEDDNIYYSPRIQGAGLVNMQKSLSAATYLTVSGKRPKADILDSQTGEYAFTFTVNNISDESVSYNLDYVIQSDKPSKDSDGNSYNTLIPSSIAENADVTMFIGEEQSTNVTVEANRSVDVTVKIKLKQSFIDSYMEYFSNGFYIDGYVFLEPSSSNCTALSMPFMGFCGDWSSCPIFDSTIYNDEMPLTMSDGCFVAVSKNNGNNNDIFSYDIGVNYYTEAQDAILAIGKDSCRNFCGDTNFQSSFMIPYFYLLRDAFDYTITISDMSGKELFSSNRGYMSSYTDSYQYEVEERLFIDFKEIEDFFKSIKDGKYIYTVSANSIGTDGNADASDSVSYEFFVDNVSPESFGSKTYVKDQKIYLELSAKDNNAVQGFELYTTTYNQSQKSYDYADRICSLIEQGYISEDSYSLEDVKNNDDGSVVFLYDITNLYSQLTRLSAVSEGEIESSSPLKIAYKAVDYAFNYSPAKIADTICYGTVTFIFTDQNGRGVENVLVDLNGEQKTSSSDGTIVFENIMPALYSANIVSVPEDYEFNQKTFLIKVDNENLDIKNEVSMKYNGEILEGSETSETAEGSEISENSEIIESSVHEQSSENSKEISEESSKVISSSDSDKTVQDTGDNSIYAVFFVGTLLVISIVSLLVSRQRSKR